MDSYDMDSSSTNEDTSSPSVFSIFHEEDIILNILSYVADVPYEMNSNDSPKSPTDSYSTLTHTLPLVCKQFYKLTSKHDLYWKYGLLRMAEKDSNWKEGLQRAIFDAKCDELRSEIRDRNSKRRGKRTKENAPPKSASSTVNISDGDISINLSEKEELVEEARKALRSSHPSVPITRIYQCLFNSIVNHHMKYKAPVFYMPSSIKLGECYGLHFFEPRYRLLISEVLSNYPISAKRGDIITPRISDLFPLPQGQRVLGGDIKASLLDLLEKNESLLQEYHLPTFIHAHQSPLRRNSPATIVQIERSGVSADGSADVLLKPISYIWLEEIWERPGTGGLLEARGIRMNKEAASAYERWSGMRAYGMGDGRGRGQQLPIP